jgi:Mn2+/Fe2+ NRAMP family transporter
MKNGETSSNEPMHVNPEIEDHRQMILQGEKQGTLGKLKAYTRLSGPGWLQSAITLGGGSLANALYLGVLGGVVFLWLQPMAMIFGVIMLSAISYVTLSSAKRPLRQINRHISPVLGWGWLLASMMANIVWALPQFSLATAAVQQNLLPGVLGPQAIPDPWGKLIIVTVLLAIAVTNILMYVSGARGGRWFEWAMKGMVGLIVICFFGVVIRLALAGQLDWGAIFSGFVPKFHTLFEPAHTYEPYLAELSERGRAFWSELIVNQQRDVIIGAAATAVGINMTFLLPYSMLRKGWDRDFRGLAIFDLATGLFIPFMLASSCVVIAAASQFHATPAPGFLEAESAEVEVIEPAPNLVNPYRGMLENRLKEELGEEDFSRLSAEEVAAQAAELPMPERRMAAMLVKRDAFNLAGSLEPLVGTTIAHYAFGIGVLGMALSSAIMLMMINGLCFCELMNQAPRGRTQLIGSLIPCVGVLGPFFWGEAQMWLAVPTSVFAMVLLPIAYVAFALMMNNKNILGRDVPRGPKRIVWNVLMGGAVLFAGLGSLWSLWAKLEWLGMILFAIFVVVVLVVRKHVPTERKAEDS